MSNKKYFVLQDPIPAEDLESFPCRVVTSKISPLDQCVPISLSGTGNPSRSTNDILPGILPNPLEYSVENDILQTSVERGMSIQLSSLFGSHWSCGEEKSITIESAAVKKYALHNPDAYFQELMKDKSYAQGVRNLLLKVWPSNAYLITGFVTVQDCKLKIEETTTKGRGFGAGVPLDGLVPSATLVPPGNVGGEMNRSSSAHRSYSTTITDERIFAISYSAVKLAYKIDTSSRSLFSRTPAIGRPQRSKAHHLAMGEDGDQDEEIGCDSDSDSGEEDAPAHPKKDPQLKSEEYSEVIIYDGDYLFTGGQQGAYIEL